MIYQNSLNGNKFTVDLIVVCNHLLDKKLREKMYGGMQVYLHLLYISVKPGGMYLA